MLWCSRTWSKGCLANWEMSLEWFTSRCSFTAVLFGLWGEKNFQGLSTDHDQVAHRFRFEVRDFIHSRRNLNPSLTNKALCVSWGCLKEWKGYWKVKTGSIVLVSVFVCSFFVVFLLSFVVLYWGFSALDCVLLWLSLIKFAAVGKRKKGDFFVFHDF